METPFFEHTKEHTKEQELPTPAPREAVGIEAEFTEQAHRDVYLALRQKHRLPAAFDATLRTLHTPLVGGVPYTWQEIGAGLLSQAGNGETFNELRLRGYCRSQREAGARSAGGSKTQHAGMQGGDASRSDTGARVTIGGAALTTQRFWDLCVETGLTARGQSASAVDGRLARFADVGQVTDPQLLRALVRHVEPWTLALITFAPDRMGKLRERFASFVSAHPEAA